MFYEDETYQITAIVDGAFTRNSHIHTMTIEGTYLVSLGGASFLGCPYLTWIDFSGCKKLGSIGGLSLRTGRLDRGLSIHSRLGSDSSYPPH